jgi:uncharacterized protein with PQ loop repeat
VGASEDGVRQDGTASLDQRTGSTRIAPLLTADPQTRPALRHPVAGNIPRMVTVLGLVCDLVGAIALVLGLFTYAQPLTPGFRRAPTEYAHDAAFGVVGATLLTVGFLLQALPYFGVSHYSRHWVTVVFAAFALAIVSALAFVAYGLLYIAFHAVEARRVAAAYPSISYNVRRQRDGVKFWNQELVPASETPTDPAAGPSV